MKKPKDIIIKNNNIYIGGVYCNSINEQAKILESIAKSKNIKNYIRKYTDDAVYNDYLRGTSELNEAQYAESIKLISNLFYVFDNIPDYTPYGYTILYRGVNIDCDIAADDKGFMSTSAEIDVAKEFGNNIMEIYLLHLYNYKILPVEPITTVKNEFEVILAPGRGKFYKCGNSYTVNSNSEVYKITRYVYVPSKTQTTMFIYDNPQFNEIQLNKYLSEYKQDTDTKPKKRKFFINHILNINKKIVPSNKVVPII